jgi:hypothetical protein
MVADTLSGMRTALSALMELDPALPGVAAVQAQFREAFAPDNEFQTWRCPKCQDIVPITCSALHIAVP